VEQRQSPYLNNRSESSHWPTRQRERRMQEFKGRGVPDRIDLKYRGRQCLLVSDGPQLICVPH
jgi:hypothetical protein